MSPAIIPAILTDSLDDFSQKMAELERWAPAVHIDVCDGRFVATRTLSVDELVPAIGRYHLPLEFHLMVADPWPEVTKIEAIAGVLPLIHAETQAVHHQVSEYLETGRPLSLVCNLATPLEPWHKIFPALRQVTLMGIEPGGQGRPLDEAIFPRLIALQATFPNLTREIDGGVNRQTIQPLREAGATKFVAGSSLWSSPEPEEAYRDLLSLIE